MDKTKRLLSSTSVCKYFGLACLCVELTPGHSQNVKAFTRLQEYPEKYLLKVIKRDREREREKTNSLNGKSPQTPWLEDDSTLTASLSRIDSGRENWKVVQRKAKRMMKGDRDWLIMERTRDIMHVTHGCFDPGRRWVSRWQHAGVIDSHSNTEGTGSLARWCWNEP